jgi:chromate reductase
MNSLPKIFAIIGSTRVQSANLQLAQWIAKMYQNKLDIEIYTQLDTLPHFNPDLDGENPPKSVTDFRKKIEEADGVLICTPEYVFSLPGSLKNALEWTVSTVVFSDKPSCLFTASSSGEKAHESLVLIMRTLGAKFNDNLQLWLKGVRNKINENGEINDPEVIQKIQDLMNHFILVLNKQ